MNEINLTLLRLKLCHSVAATVELPITQNLTLNPGQMSTSHRSIPNEITEDFLLT